MSQNLPQSSDTPPPPATKACPICTTELDVAAEFCFGCGEWVAMVPAASAPPARGSASASRGPLSAARLRESFPAGTLVAGRYRVLSATGRGGVGEEFRATDLAEQREASVTIVPAHAEVGGAVAMQFHGQVRMAGKLAPGSWCELIALEVDGVACLALIIHYNQ